MDKELYARVRRLLPEVLALPVEQREAFLDEQCRDDPALRREVEELLAADDGSREILSTGGPVVQAKREGWSPRGRIDATPPERIGPYAIGRELGRGGMGVVYFAEQTEPLRRQVALKLIKRGMDTDAVVARFENERQALAAMSHPNVAQVLDAGATDDGRPYFVMEFVDGQPITIWCDENRLTPSRRLDLFLEVCRAVQHAHQRGIIHRDLKPSNVLAFRSEEGPQVRVIDFGIAKAVEDSVVGTGGMTVAGQILGTPEYMSPEQAGIIDQPVDTRTDVYCLGALLYELLAGRPPYVFGAERLEEIQRTFRERDPLRPSAAITDPDHTSTRAADPTTATTSEEVSRQRGRSVDQLRRELAGDLDNIVLMAMHKDPDRRYPSVDALAEDIRRYRAQLPVRARPDQWTYRARKFVRRNALGVTLFGVISALLTTLLVSTLVQSQRLERERDRAVRAETDARREAATAREVSEFLVGLFEVSDPSEARGNTVTAREILDEGAQRVEQELGGQPEVQARLMHTIGAVYQNLGLYDQADTLVTGALGLREATLGPDDPQVAQSLIQKAWLLREEGLTEEALPLVERALEIQRAAYGEKHPDMNTTLYHLASIAEELGDNETAIERFREVLRLDEELLGPRHPKVPESMNNLAIALSMHGEFDEAERLYRESLRLNREIHGDDHPEVATSAANLSNLLFNFGKRDEGLALAEEAYDTRKRVLGPEHPHTAIAAGNLGIKYFGLQRYDEAERLLQESLRVKQSSNGERHPSTAHGWILLGLAQLGRDDATAAEASYAQALSIYREVMPAGHHTIARALYGLGSALTQQDRLDEAEALLVESLAIRRAALPEGHREIAESLRGLGELHTKRGAFDDAEGALTEAYAILVDIHGAEHSRARRVARSLVELFTASGDSARAAQFEALAHDPEDE